jgi:hypothetical protein
VKRLFEKTILFLSLGLFVSAMTVGCAALTGGNAAVTAGGQLLVQEATAAAIQANCVAKPGLTLQQCYDTRAAKVLTVAEQLEKATTATVVADISTLLAQQLASLNLTPEEEVPLRVLVSQLTNYLTPLINSTPILSAANLAIVQQVAGWVADEAALYAPVLSSKVMMMKAHKGT